MPNEDMVYDSTTGWMVEITPLPQPGAGRRTFTLPSPEQIYRHYDALAMNAVSDDGKAAVLQKRETALARRLQLQVSMQRGRAKKPPPETINFAQLTELEKRTPSGKVMITRQRADARSTGSHTHNGMAPISATAAQKNLIGGGGLVGQVPHNQGHVYIATKPNKSDEVVVTVTQCNECLAYVADGNVSVHHSFHVDEKLKMQQLRERLDALEQVPPRDRIKRPRPKAKP